MWNLKSDTNEHTHETETDSQTLRHREQACDYQEGAWDQQMQIYIYIYIYIYIGWKNNKVLLCSTGNYIQYPMINQNGKEYEKEYICIYN